MKKSFQKINTVRNIYPSAYRLINAKDSLPCQVGCRNPIIVAIHSKYSVFKVWYGVELRYVVFILRCPAAITVITIPAYISAYMFKVLPCLVWMYCAL